MKPWILCLVLLGYVNELSAQVYGCTDPLATNYNSFATVNDGSCNYSTVNISPAASYVLSGTLSETSGLTYWNNQIWTHNDNNDTSLYALDTLNGTIVQTISIQGVLNRDWEEISSDSDYIYIGDFGNNANGNRTDLNILRISKDSILAGNPIVDSIQFTYSNQTVFAPTGPNNTNFDCEAMIIGSDSIFLFTKQWLNNQTSVYGLPKLPGNYSALLLNTYDVQGMITGATYLEQEKAIVLCGYSNLLQPFIYMLYDFHGNDFFSGNKRKVGVSLPFHQAEGISTQNGLKYYLSNEMFVQPPIINVQQKLHELNLTGFLGNYLNSLSTNTNEWGELSRHKIYPNPFSATLIIQSNKFPVKFTISNMEGKTVLSGVLTESEVKVDCTQVPTGNYLLKLEDGTSTVHYRLVKQ